MKIVILGCGYVGSAAALFWKQKGHEVIVTTRHPENTDALQAVASKVIPFNLYTAYLYKADAVLLSVAAKNPHSYEETYLKIAEHLASHLLPDTQLLYTSSSSVYGEQGGQWVTETTTLNPLTTQAQILIETEAVLQSFHPHTSILRLGEIYGPQRELEERARSVSGQRLPGTGLNYSNTIHRDDIVGALDFLLTQRLSGLYNLSDDLHIPRVELYQHFCHKLQLPPPVWDPQLPSLHRGNKRVSTQKIRSAGYQLLHASPLET